MIWRTITIILLAIQLAGMLVLLSTVFALSFVHGPANGSGIFWDPILSSWSAILLTLVVGVAFILLLTHRVYPRAAIVLAGAALALHLYNGTLLSTIQNLFYLRLDVFGTAHVLAPFSAAYLLSGKKWHEKWFKKKKK